MTKILRACVFSVLGLLVLLAPSASAGELTVYYGAPREHVEPILKAFADAHPELSPTSNVG